jgi:FtsP/CotA-like multicopper oxidase with cupredoxin domain
VPGLSQTPIKPGDSYTYKWTATQYGSYMYHAHHQGQIEDGLYGAIIIKPKRGLKRPFDMITDDPDELDLLRAAEGNVQPLILSDWRHMTSHDSWDIQKDSKVESSSCMDSVLVNGKGAVYCWKPDEIEYFTKPEVKPLLEENDMTMTDKG